MHIEWFHQILLNSCVEQHYTGRWRRWRAERGHRRGVERRQWSVAVARARHPLPGVLASMHTHENGGFSVSSPRYGQTDEIFALEDRNSWITVRNHIYQASNAQFWNIGHLGLGAPSRNWNCWNFFHVQFSLFPNFFSLPVIRIRKMTENAPP